MPRHRLVASTLLGLLLIVTAACSGGGGSSSPADTQTRDEARQIDQIKSHVSPDVWSVIESQPWFTKAGSREAGIRLARVIGLPATSATETQLKELVAAYPDGIPDDVYELMQRFRQGGEQRAFLGLAWVKDGISPVEQQVAQAVLAESLSTNRIPSLVELISGLPWSADGIDPTEADAIGTAFSIWLANTPMAQTILVAIGEPWFQDGITPAETTLFDYAVFTGRNGSDDRANAIFDSVRKGTFRSTEATMPISGMKQIIVMLTPEATDAQVTRGLQLVSDWLPKVEAVAGVYQADAVLLSVANAVPGTCGTGTPQFLSTYRERPAPGYLTLNPRCLQPVVVVHELVHLITGGGPLWFTEGAADYIALRLTGVRSSYLAANTSGLIEPSGRTPANGSTAYVNQGGLGAKLMVDLAAIIGDDSMTLVLEKIASWGASRPSTLILAAFEEAATPEQLPRVKELLRQRINYPPGTP